MLWNYFYLLIMYNMKLFGRPIRIEVVVISMILGAILNCYLFGSCCHTSPFEAFSLKKHVQWKNVRGEKAGGNADGICSAHGSFCSPSVSTIKEDTAETSGSKFSDKMFFFHDNEFTPECCGSEFSNSQGCACLTQEQKNFINRRGGNRTVSHDIS